MFDMILNKLSGHQKGIVCLVLGFILVFGALGKLGFLQDSLNIIMIVVGAYLLFCGAQAMNLMGKLKSLKGRK